MLFVIGYLLFVFVVVCEFGCVCCFPCLYVVYCGSLCVVCALLVVFQFFLCPCFFSVFFLFVSLWFVSCSCCLRLSVGCLCFVLVSVSFVRFCC